MYHKHDISRRHCTTHRAWGGDRGFEARLFGVLFALGLVLLLNAWVVTRSEEPAHAPWASMHRLLASLSMRP